MIVKLTLILSMLCSPSCVVAAAATNTTVAARESAAPVTPREFFNAGTREFRAGRLREAEAFLESALATQNERLQTPALYNLGHVRFSQGVEELKKGPSAGASAAMSRMAQEQGEATLRAADEALESNEVQKMVAAYLHGRGKRKELKAAREAVLQALQAHRATLAKWERSSGDFKSAVELDSAQPDARLNADIVDRRIAQLVDSLRQLQQNVGGALPGIGTMANYGGMRYTNAVFAEDEDALPSGWPPHGTERHGFTPGTSSMLLTSSESRIDRTPPRW